MSDEDSGSDNNQLVEEGDNAQGIQLPGVLEELKGENPTIMGFDYYKVIYLSAAGLCLTMIFLYMVIDDP